MKLSHNLYWSIIRTSRNNKFTRTVIDYSALWFYKTFRKNKTFRYQGKELKYFYHIYNRTVASERVIEIPIAKFYLDKFKGKKVLEIGNVLWHYFYTQHAVVDKYEKGLRVINKDVVSFKLPGEYDLILSISTMEHVGYSYGEKMNPAKFSQGISNLKKHLKKGGLLVVTFPLYYNEYITDLIKKNKSPFSKETFFKRVSYLNEWGEVSRNEALKGNAYEGHFANANVLYIGEFLK